MMVLMSFFFSYAAALTCSGGFMLNDTFLDMGCTAVVGTLRVNNLLPTLDMTRFNVSSVGTLIIDSTNLTTLDGLETLSQVGTALTVTSNPVLVNLSGVQNLEVIGKLTITNNPKLVDVHLPLLISTTGTITSNGVLQTIRCETLGYANAFTISNNRLLSLISLPQLVLGGGLEINTNPSLPSLIFPNAAYLNFDIVSNFNLRDIQFPALTQTITFNIDNNTNLRSVSAPILTVGAITHTLANSPNLQNVSFPRLTSVQQNMDLRFVNINCTTAFPVLSSVVRLTLNGFNQPCNFPNLTAVKNMMLTGSPMIDFTGWRLPRAYTDSTSSNPNAIFSSLPHLSTLDGLGIVSGRIQISQTPMLRDVQGLSTVLSGTLSIDSGFCCPPDNVFSASSPLLTVVDSKCVICASFSTQFKATSSPGLTIQVPTEITIDYSGNLPVYLCQNGQDIANISMGCTVQLATQTAESSLLCQVPYVTGHYYLSFDLLCGNLTVGVPPLSGFTIPELTVQDWSSYFGQTLPPIEVGVEPEVKVTEIHSDDLPTAALNEALASTVWQPPVIAGIAAFELLVFFIFWCRKSLHKLVALDRLGYQHTKRVGEAHSNDLDPTALDRSSASVQLPLLRRRSAAGGLLSIFVLLVTIILTTSYLYDSVVYNDITSTTLDPDFGSLAFPASNYYLDLTLEGYNGFCVTGVVPGLAPATTGPCASSLRVTTVQTAQGLPTTQCISSAPEDPRSCTVQWSCLSCMLGLTTDITINGDVNSFAMAYAWSISSISYVGQPFVVSNRVDAPPGYFFKGTPTSIAVTATAANYSRGERLQRGVVTQQSTIVPGSLQDPLNFQQSVGGIAVNVRIARNLNVLVISEKTRHTGLDITAGALALLTGISQAAIILLYLGSALHDGCTKKRK